MSNHTRDTSGSCYDADADLYADPSVRPSRRSTMSQRRDSVISDGRGRDVDVIQLDPGLRRSVHRHFQSRSASDSKFVKGTVDKWLETPDGRSAVANYKERNLKESQRKAAEARAEKEPDLPSKRLEFAHVKLVRSLSAPESTIDPRDPVRRFREQVEQVAVHDAIRHFDRLDPIMSVPVSGDHTPDECAVLEEEEDTNKRLCAVGRVLMAEREQFEHQANSLFEIMVHKHETEFNHDILLLRFRMLSLYSNTIDPYVAKTTEIAYGALADKACLAGARQAFELNRILLIKHYFDAKIAKLRAGPIANRTEKHLVAALRESVHEVVQFAREGDGYHHSQACLSNVVDWGCEGCREHAHHLYKPRNDKLHQKVMALRLYCFQDHADPPVYAEMHEHDDSQKRGDEEMWDLKYLFAAFGPLFVAVRKEVHLHQFDTAMRAESLRRIVIAYDEFHREMENKKPNDLHRIHDLFDEITRHFGDPQRVSIERIKEMCVKLKQSLREAGPVEEHPAPRRLANPVRSNAAFDPKTFHSKATSEVKHRVEKWDQRPHLRVEPTAEAGPATRGSNHNGTNDSTASISPVESVPDSPSSWVRDLRKKMSFSALRGKQSPGRGNSRPGNGQTAQRPGPSIRRFDSAHQHVLPELNFHPFDANQERSTSTPTSIASSVRGPRSRSRASSNASSSHNSSSPISTAPSPRGRTHTQVRDFEFEPQVPFAAVAYSPARRPRGRSASVHRRQAYE